MERHKRSLNLIDIKYFQRSLSKCFQEVQQRTLSNESYWTPPRRQRRSASSDQISNDGNYHPNMTISATSQICALFIGIFLGIATGIICHTGVLIYSQYPLKKYIRTVWSILFNTANVNRS